MLRPEVPLERGRGTVSGALGDVERLQHVVCEQPGLRQACQLNHPDAVGELPHEPAGHLDGQARFADPTRAGHGHEPGAPQEPRQRRDFVFPTDEAREAGRQVVRIAP